MDRDKPYVLICESCGRPIVFERDGLTAVMVKEWSEQLQRFVGVGPYHKECAPKESVNSVLDLRRQLSEALRDVERLKIRGAAYEEAYRIAYQATYQSHSGHWDRTMRGGAGCPECIRAREARENCDKALHDGLQKLIDLAK